MYNVFVYNQPLYNQPIVDPDGSFLLVEGFSLAESPSVAVAFTVNEFIFSSDAASFAPDRALGDTIRFNDWLTVKAKRNESKFGD